MPASSSREGRLFLEIPNGMAINYIESDGHYKLPGITLLDHTDAERWFRAFYEDQYPYNTYFYAPVDYYLALFSRNGMPLQAPQHTESPTRSQSPTLADQWAQDSPRLQTLDQRVSRQAVRPNRRRYGTVPARSTPGSDDC